MNRELLELLEMFEELEGKVKIISDNGPKVLNAIQDTFRLINEIKEKSSDEMFNDYLKISDYVGSANVVIQEIAKTLG